ncbi:hypothetical protein ACE6H2_018540 [Prunus campanulata]
MDFDEGCMDLDICVHLVAILGSIFSGDSLCALETCSAVCRSLIVAGHLGQ